MYGTDDELSGDDFIIVFKSSMIKSKDGNTEFENNAIPLEDGSIQGVYYSIGVFIDAINNYEIAAWEYLALPDEKVIMYVFIGLLFAILRTYFESKELNKEYEYDSLEKFKKELDLKSSVFRWWFLFPISAITWLFGTLLFAKVGTMFYNILNA